MIDGHIISIESNSNSFNVACGFNKKTHSSKGDALMNLNVQDEWYKKFKKHKINKKSNNHLLNIKKCMT